MVSVRVRRVPVLASLNLLSRLLLVTGDCLPSLSLLTGLHGARGVVDLSPVGDSGLGISGELNGETSSGSWLVRVLPRLRMLTRLADRDFGASGLA